jgi:LPXTG-site transpeptidase (sortase) family protein
MSRIGQRRRSRFQILYLLVLVPLVVGLFALWQQVEQIPSAPVLQASPTLPARLTRQDVLPTLTPVPNAPVRQIIFPGAHVVASIVPSYRVGDSWETRYLGDSVGLLEGASWLDDPGGNIVLVGHVEDAEGHPGPFAYLFNAQVGDVILLRDGDRRLTYRVSSIQKTAPDDLHILAQDGQRRITMITCSDWDLKSGTYLSRLVAIAQPA